MMQMRLVERMHMFIAVVCSDMIRHGETEAN